LERKDKKERRTKIGRKRIERIQVAA